MNNKYVTCCRYHFKQNHFGKIKSNFDSTDDVTAGLGGTKNKVSYHTKTTPF